MIKQSSGLIPFLVRHRKPIFVATATVFLIGIFVGLGGYLLTDRDLAGTVAEVAGEKIPERRFQLQVRNILDRYQGGQVTDEIQNRVRQEVLRDLLVESLLAQQAEKLGLMVTDREVADDIRETFKREGRFDQQLYFYTVQSQFRMTPEQYEVMRRRSLLHFKYRQLVSRSAKVTPAEVRLAYQKEKGGLKDFEKNEPEFRSRMQQRRSLETLNYLLRQLAATTDIKTYLQ